MLHAVIVSGSLLFLVLLREPIGMAGLQVLATVASTVHSGSLSNMLPLSTGQSRVNCEELFGRKTERGSQEHEQAKPYCVCACACAVGVACHHLQSMCVALT